MEFGELSGAVEPRADRAGHPGDLVMAVTSLDVLITHRLSRPASSAVVARRVTVGPICSASQGNAVIPMPICMGFFIS